MILESTPLAGAEPRRDEVARPARASRARRGADGVPTTVKQSYARVANDIAEGASKVSTEPKRPSESAQGFSLWESSAFGFGDFLDIVNPLQHIPIVATIYRNLTGDRIGMAPRVIGGALWGRIGGLVSGVVNSVVEFFTGKDIGDHIYAKIWGAPDTSNNKAVAAKPADRNGDVSQVSTQRVIAAPAHESAAVPDDPAPLHVAAVNQEIDAPTVLVPQTEREAIVPRHIHHLPYRRNDDLNETLSGAAKLDVNA